MDERPIVSKPWNYDVTIVDGRNILTVVCGTVGVFELKIAISDSELAELVRSKDETPAFVESVRRHPDSFRDRLV